MSGLSQTPAPAASCARSNSPRNTLDKRRLTVINVVWRSSAFGESVIGSPAEQKT